MHTNATETFIFKSDTVQKIRLMSLCPRKRNSRFPTSPHQNEINMPLKMCSITAYSEIKQNIMVEEKTHQGLMYLKRLGIRVSWSWDIPDRKWEIPVFVYVRWKQCTLIFSEHTTRHKTTKSVIKWADKQHLEEFLRKEHLITKRATLTTQSYEQSLESGLCNDNDKNAPKLPA